jgi:hypothetical protein
MRRLLVLGIVIISALKINSQVEVERYDTIVRETIYTSYYSKKIEGPSFVVYKLYKGGGDVDRKGMTFSSPFPHFQYKGSGYDKGHLCPAEDFAYSRELEKLTFRYYNTVPMTKKLNRGKWETVEEKVRDLSQNDSLLIISGGSSYSGLIPMKCFKLVYSLTTGAKLISLVFSNSDTKVDMEQIDLSSLFKFCSSTPSKLLIMINKQDNYESSWK